MTMIKLENVSKKFPTGVFALTEVSFEVTRGEFVFLVGPTGSGKTTIFRLIIREILPSSGTITVDGANISKLSRKGVSNLRKKIGVVFQDLKLLIDRTVSENISLPLEVSGVKAMDAKKKVDEIMAKVGIEEHRDKFPVQLSGGELQKTAIARALVLSPNILLADEPTGDLDETTASEIVKQLLEINQKGTTIIMATHSLDIIKALAKRMVVLDRGKLVRDDKGREGKK
ncbi:MAG: ATP-binding cassette domain-containing protein [Patescibacteria group bacterium]|mgnify:CR=1 FL=1